MLNKYVQMFVEMWVYILSKNLMVNFNILLDKQN